jgi:hypothetical protein
VPSRKSNYEVAVKRCPRAHCHDQASVRLRGKTCDGKLDLMRILHLDRDHFHL